jgi:ATP-dependent helicase Lhr and Lhr-like helicase
MEPTRLHPLVARWFSEHFAAPTAAQSAGWQDIAAGRDTLIAAPTGSGKTLAAFLWAINELIAAGSSGSLDDQTSVVYVSPLKALANDIQKNLQQPLAEIRELAAAGSVALPNIRVLVRSGDTPAHERQSMVRRPPHILITTPESLYILLTAERSRRMLTTAHTVIVDEIHAVAGDKRGAHLALSLERLDALAGRHLQRIGLSATQKPIDEIAQLLVGRRDEAFPSASVAPLGRKSQLALFADAPMQPEMPRPYTPDCAIVDVGHKRQLDLSVEVTGHELGPIATHELYADVYDCIAAHVRAHRTTIVFVNTRRLVERVAHQLEQRLGEGHVAAHHGSMSRRARLQAEEGLKSGGVPVVVATASLELGIDVGHVDLVCHLGAPRALATLLQRVGRSGHWLGAIPKGILFPLTRDDLVQCAAAIRAVCAGELDRIAIPQNPLDILAQQIVATIAAGDLHEEELWQLVRRAYPFRHLPRADFEAVLEMLSEGVATQRGRRSAHLHRDRVHHKLRARRGARLAAITSGGAIPDNADYDVVEDPAGTFVGKVNEDFAVESMAGDIFLLGNRSWKIRRVEAGRVRVEDAHGAPPTIPFWLGEAPARSAEMSIAVSELRAEVGARLSDLDTAAAWLMAECHVDRAAADQIVAYVAETRAVLGVIPTQRTIVAERFFDESGGMQLIVHAPFGGRINRAWGLALRKRFCRTFNFELQAAATDDGIVISLGEQHSFALDGVFAMVRSTVVEADLVQAALAAPMFGTRWRWNAARALALLRHMGGKRVPMPIQRMRAEDLLAAVFPAQLACGDNQPPGPIDVPDHPLVNETIDNCLHEAMDVDGLRAILEAIERGALRTVAIETAAPSPMSHEILNANPYAFLDDAPLEERRARAVSLRRVDPELASGIGALDTAAIEEVRAQAWPDVRDADELHDVLMSVVLLPSRGQTFPPPSATPVAMSGDLAHCSNLPARGEMPRSCAASWTPLGTALIADRRATVARWGDHAAFVAAERVHVVAAAVPDVTFDPGLSPIPGSPHVEPEDAVRAIVQGWIECIGPTTSAQLAERLGLPERAVDTALLRLESEGAVLRGSFTPSNPHALTPSRPRFEWCDRRLLARIHRLTIGRLRREIEAVPAADFVRFLLRWQHVQAGTQLHGRDGVRQIIAQLQGLELPAPAWERDVLPARINLYDPADLEHLCLAGEVAWARLRTGISGSEDDAAPPATRPRRRTAPTRSAPLAFVLRDALPALLESAPSPEQIMNELSPAARDVFAHLQRHGASFLSDIARATGRLPGQTEDALWELVARGLVTGDGIAGLRTLLLPELKRRPSHRRLRSIRGGAARRAMPVGRWAILRTAIHEVTPEDAREVFARQLLQRYGVVVRELLAREPRAPAWRLLLGIYRRMEARGEIRGGRFVAGLVGEQFALPEAVDALRTVRRAPEDSEPVIVAAADPLNLAGILTSGARLSPASNQVVAYQNGVPTQVGELGTVMSRLQRRPAAKSDG